MTFKQRFGLAFMISGCTWLILNQDNGTLTVIYYFMYLVGIILFVFGKEKE